MVIIQALISLFIQTSGRLLTTMFGWATNILFGRVAQRHRIWLSVITFSAVIWFCCAIGIIIPALGTFLLTSFIPELTGDSEHWVRTGMLAGTLLIPLLISLFTHKLGSDVQQSQSNQASILMGYPLTLGLALTVLMLMIFAPLIKLKDVLRKWTTAHIPIIVRADRYLVVLNEIEQILHKSGVVFRREKADWMLRIPTQILGFLARDAMERFIAEELTVLKAEEIHITLHPSDLVLSGKKRTVNRLRAAFTKHFAFTEAFLTSDQESMLWENRIRQIWQSLSAEISNYKKILEELNTIEYQISSRALPYEDWEILYREILQLERQILRALNSGKVITPHEAMEDELQKQFAQKKPEMFPQKEPGLLEKAIYITVGGIASIAEDAGKLLRKKAS